MRLAKAHGSLLAHGWVWQHQMIQKVHINAFILFREKFCTHIHQHTQWYVFITLLRKYSKLVAGFDFCGKSIFCTRLDRVSILLRVLGSWSCSNWSCQEFCSWPVWEQESRACLPCLRRMDIKQTSTISNLHKCALRQRKDWHLPESIQVG